MGSARAAKGRAGKFCFFHEYFSSLPACFWDSIWFRAAQYFSYFPLILFFWVFFKSNLVNSNVGLSCQVHSLVICDGFQSSWWKRVYKSCYFNCMTKGMPSLSWWHAFSFWTLSFSGTLQCARSAQQHSCIAGEEGGVCLATIPRGIQNSTVLQIWEMVCFCLLSKPPLLKSPRDDAN